ncbi:Hypothetical protein OINT_1001755 [Brucella intermedia LMG 3301]|uniref:Uncharacterized protein n=1 Tax=Brucella intermedia LMG 3301 TaxID=641118 RepID=C4WFM3_9HYPH|nr:hypothetical protein [Brucella intermedia]EEQ96329.1 Hypothetical protein OINT_1001755 [Brucella intermedia LMG 3301]NKB95741.1 hypothetical protein [Brucella intermedia]SUB13314.1 Uncharacterised protein [Brucella intermedia]
MEEKLYSTFWIYSESMGVFGRLCAAEDALVGLEPDARLIPDKPDGDCRFDPALNEWVLNPAFEPTPEEKRELMPVITKRQLRLTLVRNGISLAQVEAAIAAMPEGLPKQEAEIEWADASEFRRLHPTLLLVAQALNLSEEQVDAMWEEAVLA